MALIEINPELSKLVRVGERIAEALELLLLHAYGVRVEATTKPIADPNPSEKQTVSYATDEETAIERLKELGGMFRRGADEPEDEDVLL
jgi:hypothetical protein